MAVFQTASAWASIFEVILDFCINGPRDLVVNVKTRFLLLAQVVGEETV